MAGIIYHKLGKKFLSPTINLYIFTNDFLKMVSNLKWYMDQELYFIDYSKPFPVGAIGEGEDQVKIFFNHYKTKGEAKQKWDERKSRINYDNLYVIAYYDDMIKPQDLEILKNVKCNNK